MKGAIKTFKIAGNINSFTWREIRPSGNRPTSSTPRGCWIRHNRNAGRELTPRGLWSLRKMNTRC